MGKLSWFVVYPALLIAVTGCSGIHASKSVSPLDFFLPGLLQTTPPTELPPDSTVPPTDPVQQVAQI